MKELSIHQLRMTLLVSIIGAGGFAFLRGLGEYVGKNGWMVTIACGVISLISMYLILYISKVNGYVGIGEIVENSLGKFIGRIVLIEFAIFIIINGSLQVRDYAEVIKVYLLNRTPIQLILLVLILLSTYLIIGRIEALIKFNEITVWIMLVPALVVLLFVIGRGKVTNVLPFFDFEKTKFLEGIKVGINSFTSFEILYFLLPRLKEEERKKLKYSVAGVVGIAVAFYILLYTAIIYYFGAEESQHLLWPFIGLVKSIDIPGTFIERWDGLILMIYMIFNFAAFVNIYYGAAYITKKVFNFKRMVNSFSIVSVLFYIGSMLPKNILENNALQDNFLSYLFLINNIVIPIVLIIGLKIRRGRYEEA